MTQISQTVSDLRASFDTGRSRPVDWRRAQLHRLKAMIEGLRHAAVCPAPSHAACPSFQRLLKAAASGALEQRQRQAPMRRRD